MAYDNTNRAALWDADAFSGNANLAGEHYYATLVPTNAKNDRAPTHMLYLRKGREALTVALFASSKPPSVASGSVEVDGTAYWVNLYENDSQNPQAPKFNVQFREKEARASERSPAETFYDQPAEQPSMDNDSELPF